MAGRRLVDLAKLLSASKGVASKHIALRQQQLDVYTKTSSLAKAVKSQTDRVTLTAQAAIALATRLNEERPKYTWESQSSGTGYEASKKDTTEPAVKDELDVCQKKAESAPFPDGTIPPAGSKVEPTLTTHPHHELSPDEARKLEYQYEKHIPVAENIPQFAPKNPKVQSLEEGHDRDVFYLRSNEAQPEPSSLPRVKIPKHTETVQESDEHVDDKRINQDVFYSRPHPNEGAAKDAQGVPQKVAVPEQEAIPEGINTNVFHSKRVAAMLSGNPYKRENPYKKKPELKMVGAARTPVDKTKLAQGHDQDTFNVRTERQTKPAIPEAPENPEVKTATTTEKEMHDFASELAKDVGAAPSAISEVLNF